MITTVPTVPVQQGRRGTRRKTRLVTLYRLIDETRFDDLDEPSLVPLPWFLENVDIAGLRGLRR